MKYKGIGTKYRFAVLVPFGLTGCLAPADEFATATDSIDVAVVQAALIGDHLRGVGDAEFEEAKAAFLEVEGAADGLGPIFNERSCGGCHFQGAIGGASDLIERRFGRFDNDRFNPLSNKGGSLRQLNSLGAWTNSSGKACNVPLEAEPRDATVRNVGRLATPLFGLGLVDALPDSFFTNLAQSQRREVRGTVNMVDVLLPDPSDGNQRVGSRRVGRFGWKADVPNLVQFAADAYLNEMGITTRHCVQGRFVETFAAEPAPNGTKVAPECEDGLPGLDDAVETCSGTSTEIQDDVVLFARFMTFLAPPPRDGGERDLRTNDRDAPAGQRIFDNVGCNDCHTRQAFTTPRNPRNGVPGEFSFNPFSDFLLHDMGKLGDQIGKAGDSRATTRRMRTAPLWGIRFRTRLLHDGRATDITAAIQAHDGQAAAAARAFANLSRGDQRSLLEFVSSL